MEDPAPELHTSELLPRGPAGDPRAGRGGDQGGVEALRCVAVCTKVDPERRTGV